MRRQSQASPAFADVGAIKSGSLGGVTKQTETTHAHRLRTARRVQPRPVTGARARPGEYCLQGGGVGAPPPCDPRRMLGCVTVALETSMPSIESESGCPGVTMSRSTCPKCQGAMEYVSQDGLPTATCGQCGGAWVDIAEVEHLGYGVPAAHELVEVFTTLAARELPPADHACPGCAQPLLLASYGGVEVDLCPSCKGLYLDRFELASVLDPHTTRHCPKCSSPMHVEELSDVRGLLEVQAP